ncbi:putative ubiquinone biosynthesis monooxygenase [Friedmanniomyces endolithicus]|nr:putative ubiquinone biosynthesis monooxygenase [Friedmanniomyces endolithicus]KAK0976833.1 putative ubiquinone biosynthesis monooxygenase [Friedmanniomyces endolithicus]KAK1043692.1 putative ubiquinone biosynthesis monooxygenase [Friedmanniomyces endolithicus]
MLAQVLAFSAVVLALHSVFCTAQCNNATTTLRDAADITQLASCKTFTGTIVVATDSAAVMDIPGLETVQGDFIAANNSLLTTLSSSTFSVITGTVLFQNLPFLTNLTLPNWISSGTLHFDTVPDPTVHDFQQNGQQVNNLIVRNTTFAFLAGLALQGAQMDTLEIVDIPFLQIVNLEMGNMSQSATIAGSSADLVVMLPNLTYAYDISVSNGSQVVLPRLQAVNGGMSIGSIKNPNISAPSLTFVGGDLSISDCGLSELDSNELVNVQGSVNLVNNAQLADLSGLSSLSVVGGLDLVGSFTNTTLPSLRRVQGNALINSTQALNCSDISSTLVQGTYTCHAAVFVSASTSNAASPPSHGLTGGAIGGIVVGIIVALALLATGLLVIYRRQQRAGRRPPAQQEHSRRVEDPVHEVETEQRRRDPAEKDAWRESATPASSTGLPRNFPRIASVQEGSIASFPLRMRHADTYTGHRIALIGDAAHTIHPLAGQGLNLGLADAESLVQRLAYGVDHGMDVGSCWTLDGYNSDRWAKNNAVIGVVDKLSKIYGVSGGPVVWGRSAGVEVLERLGTLKGWMMGAAAGVK